VTGHAILVATLLAAAPPPAQEPPADANAKTAVAAVEEEITVSARAAQSPTAAVTLYDAEEIERRAAHDGAELVRTAAGVHLLSSGPRGGTAHAFTRGGDANFTLVLLDGIPLNDATDVQGGAFDLATVGADDVGSVEILRGPYSYFFGSSAVAGAINLVTRDGRGGPDGRLRAEAGESSLVRAGVSVSGLTGDPERGDFFVGARVDEEEGAIADDSFEQTLIHGAAGFDLGARAALRVVARATDIDSEDYPEGSGGPLFGSGELRRGARRQLSLGLQASLGGAAWRHAASASANRADGEVDSPAVFPLVPASIEDRHYGRAQLAWLTTGDATAALRLSFGAQLDHEDGENQSTLFLAPELGGDVAGDYGLDRTTPGVFASGTVTRGDLVIEGGLRADDPEELGVEWSPRLGLRYRIGESGWSVRGGWSQAFKLPSFFALASPPALGGNPDLVPETSEGADLGVELGSGSASLAVTLWTSSYDDLVDFDFETFLHVNRSRIEADGVELQGRWRASERVRVDSAWTVQDLEGASDANVVLHSPEWFGNVGVEWSAADSVRIRVEGRFAGETADVQIPLPERAQLDDWQVVDVAASWRVAERWLVRGYVDNLADEEYQHFAGFPQPGRTARVGVEYDFR
jgi:outer membrane cobalamin receptor